MTSWRETSLTWNHPGPLQIPMTCWPWPALEPPGSGMTLIPPSDTGTYRILSGSPFLVVLKHSQPLHLKPLLRPSHLKYTTACKFSISSAPFLLRVRACMRMCSCTIGLAVQLLVISIACNCYGHFLPEVSQSGCSLHLHSVQLFFMLEVCAL